VKRKGRYLEARGKGEKDRPTRTSIMDGKKKEIERGGKESGMLGKKPEKETKNREIEKNVLETVRRLRSNHPKRH